MPHLCHAINCQTPVPRSKFMCRRHWFMLTKSMRDAVWEAYEPGQEDRMDPSPAYMKITRICIAYIAQKEAA